MNKNAHLQQGVTAGKVGGPWKDRIHREKESRNLPGRLEFLQDAGMGLFIHWSLDSQLGCVISHSLVGASKAYADRFYDILPKTLEEGEWNFAHLAHVARLAGFCYAVLTTKHHNGFCLWDTASTSFNVMNTRIGKDLVRAYAEAFRAEGIAVGLYFSPEDFWFLRQQGLPITREPKEPYEPAVEKAYVQHLQTQMKELLSNYGPIDVLFFDGGEMMILEDGRSLQDVCMDLSWDLQPNVLITRGAIPTPEQRIASAEEVGQGEEVDAVEVGQGSVADADKGKSKRQLWNSALGAEPWEACFTIGSAWQHQPSNEVYKSGREIIRLLVDTRAKGGSLLLNIGPDERGRLVPEEEAVLKELTLWHFINEECVHDVRPWKVIQDHGAYMLSSKDGSAVYAVIMDQPFPRGQREEVVLQSVGLNTDSKVEVLGSTSQFVEYHPKIDTTIRAEEKDDGLHLSLVRAQRIYCGMDWTNPMVVKITHPRIK